MKHLKTTLFFVLIIYQNMANASISYSDKDLMQLEETKTCIKCDLSHANLHYFIYHNNSILSEANLYLADFSESNFRNSNFSRAILKRAEDYNSDFIQSDFSGAQMHYMKMNFSSLSGAIFIDANLENVSFHHVNLSSTDFTGANTKGVDFSRSILIGSNITNEQLSVAKSLSCAVMPDGSVHPADEYDWCG